MNFILIGNLFKTLLFLDEKIVIKNRKKPINLCLHFFSSSHKSFTDWRCTLVMHTGDDKENSRLSAMLIIYYFSSQIHFSGPILHKVNLRRVEGKEFFNDFIYVAESARLIHMAKYCSVTCIHLQWVCIDLLVYNNTIVL
jgi:hypothetical protein